MAWVSCTLLSDIRDVSAICTCPKHIGTMTLTSGVQRPRPTLDPEDLTISPKQMRQAISGRVDLSPHYIGKEERDRGVTHRDHGRATAEG